MIVFLKSLLYFQITFNSNEPNLEGFNLQIAFSFDLLEISSLIFSGLNTNNIEERENFGFLEFYFSYCYCLHRLYNWYRWFLDFTQGECRKTNCRGDVKKRAVLSCVVRLGPDHNFWSKTTTFCVCFHSIEELSKIDCQAGFLYKHSITLKG